MKKTKTVFQSYLIQGAGDNTSRELANLAKNLNIKISANSPDVLIIAPIVGDTQHKQSANVSISINQVREIKRLIFQKPLIQSFYTIIIYEAQKLTIEAQNALLKILEEPPKSAVIILVAQNNSALLPTILSRVTIIKAASKVQDKDANKSLITLYNASFLKEISSIKDPIIWLDEQIISDYMRLTKEISANRPISFATITDTIEKCIEAKKMISANVNHKFVLFNLALQLDISR